MNFIASTDEFVQKESFAGPFLPEFDKLTPEEKDRFVSSFIYTRSSKEGLRLPFTIAKTCMYYYLNAMGTHGFLIRPFPIPNMIVPKIRQITYAEDFNAVDLQKFVSEILIELEKKNAGWEHYFKLVLGMYTPEVLIEIKDLYPHVDVSKLEDRTTIFVVPYSLSPALPVIPGVPPPPVEEYQYPIVYDFGGLQP
ncbi:hypothetical protein [Chitinophaga pinensis]|uniref:Uncharacterized protein n=1 Tax=Chitinophaga pinensis (strain ATCC 43595 / DSM 2588 / LMG 13176 / NBRC 15968 / NCIMB 11800 / UQM 2034) TaxID=485918 RepID=A0A979FYL8_CHIPD|nr:hypothetical protein [Chitinophaga pinensis]ACU57522.1 hypothetical protein Cpin_0013 [Chitinophaga pinensis DSM 2588]